MVKSEKVENLLDVLTQYEIFGVLQFRFKLEEILASRNLEHLDR